MKSIKCDYQKEESVYNNKFQLLFNKLLKEGIEIKNIILLLTELENEFKAIAKSYGIAKTNYDIELTQGVAINPNLAAQCFSDYLRTHRFMLGVYRCVCDLRAATSNQLRILYAGTGPYATIILPLLYLFNPNDIAITAIEINPDSLGSVQRIMEFLGKQHYFESITLADATTYSPTGHFDIIISETMDKALSREPQLAIFSNLVQFLSPNGHLIPECIRVNLLASSIKLEKNVPYNQFDDKQTCEINRQHRHHIENVICANIDFYNNYHLTPGTNIYLRTVSTKEISPLLNELLFITEVVVYKNIELLEDDSNITKKYIGYSFVDADRGKNFDVFYLNNQSPRLELSVKS